MPRSFFVTSVLIAGLSLACIDEGPTLDPETDLTPLIEALRERGFSVEIADESTLPFLTGVGTVVLVDGERIEVFEYPDAASAAREAGWFSADGSSIVTEDGRGISILWVATPHLFLNKSLLVLYIGDSEPLLAVLVEYLGPQIAGR